MHAIRDGVIDGIARETICSEACICIIVQHELAQSLSLLNSELERISSVEQAAHEALLGVFESSVPFHTFSVNEATRGVIHGLLSAGLDISYVTHTALRGIRQALLSVDVWSPEHEAAMREGVKSALVDLGMNGLEDDQALDLPAYYRTQTLLFGKSLF